MAKLTVLLIYVCDGNVCCTLIEKKIEITKHDDHSLIFNRFIDLLSEQEAGVYE